MRPNARSLAGGAPFYPPPRWGRIGTLPYEELFLGLLGVHMVWSAWNRLDSRYLIAGALVLLVAAAVVDAGGATAAANTVAVYVFFLLAGGVVLLLVDHVRVERRVPPAPPASSDRGDGRTRKPASHSPNKR
ncbi:MAG: hypothetical protein L3J97_04615 [Thermoplasmata archaeon]|nr:hypothetical protein [Thermoplasmata archaeon]